MSIFQTVRNMFGGGTRDPGPMRQEPSLTGENLYREGTTDPGVMAPPPTRPEGSIDTGEAPGESGLA